MLQKQAFYRRKLKSLLKIILFSIILSVGVFFLCWGVWYYLRQHESLQSPLSRSIANKKINTQLDIIQRYCLQYEIKCTSIAMQSDDTASVMLDADQLVIFSFQKDLKIQFASLQLTIRAFTIEGKRFHRLDFRFDKPVITN